MGKLDNGWILVKTNSSINFNVTSHLCISCYNAIGSIQCCLCMYASPKMKPEPHQATDQIASLQEIQEKEMLTNTMKIQSATSRM